MVSAGSLRIDGQVKGKISADGDVVLSPGCQVEADISAQNVTIGGPFKGNITAKGRTELAKGGRVDGDIICKSLVVAEGAVFCGQSIMDQQGAQAHAAAQGRASEVKATARPSPRRSNNRRRSRNSRTMSGHYFGNPPR